MKPKKGWRNPMSMLPQVQMRGPDDPTEYEVAAKTLSQVELVAWVRRWYLSRYVPEEVLADLGLEDRTFK